MLAIRAPQRALGVSGQTLHIWAPHPARRPLPGIGLHSCFWPTLATPIRSSERAVQRIALRRGCCACPAAPLCRRRARALPPVGWRLGCALHQLSQRLRLGLLRQLIPARKWAVQCCDPGCCAQSRESGLALGAGRASWRQSTKERSALRPLPLHAALHARTCSAHAAACHSSGGQRTC